jgi:hypothetical protein
LNRTDAAVILYACRALQAKLEPQVSLTLARAIKAYERQLPATLSRLAEEHVDRIKEG